MYQNGSAILNKNCSAYLELDEGFGGFDGIKVELKLWLKVELVKKIVFLTFMKRKIAREKSGRQATLSKRRQNLKSFFSDSALVVLPTQWAGKLYNFVFITLGILSWGNSDKHKSKNETPISVHSQGSSSASITSLGYTGLWAHRVVHR